jgi:GntR family transcriptional repressor for pyruvate dehydrogenase complex
MVSRVRKTRNELGDITVKLLSSFKELIANGTLVPGSKLPPERVLARQFRVNRSSLRQALKVLQLFGVLRQRVGDGTYLNADADRTLLEPIEFMIVMEGITDSELFDARLLVESELAARAAERATAEHLAVLRRALREMEGSRTEKARLEADLAFHEGIFRASGNRVCRLIFTMIQRAVLVTMKKLVRKSGLNRPLAYHRAIYSAIYHRNPEEARRHMREHLLDAQSQMNSPIKHQFSSPLLRPIVPGRRRSSKSYW